ncbi:GYF domain-containing protein [Lysobacter enzymogenes]|uniref:GYF domain-containing protein n=1 Tax=Lysobacter enzymogenes TaxID=69 RepID=UPI00384D9591
MTNWYYHDPSQGRVGPIDGDAVREHFRAGRIQRDTLVWREGLREWQPLQRLENELGLGVTPPPLPLDIAAAPAPAATPALAAAPSSHGRADFTAALDAAEAPRSQASAPAPSAPEATASNAASSNAAPANTAASNAAPSAAGSSPAASAPPQPQRSVSPADYAPAHVRRQSAPPPKRGLSGCAIALIVVAVLAIPVIGILAAIALPAYQDYTHRAKLAGALAASNDYKLQVAQYYAAHQKCPNNASDGFRPAADYASALIASVQFGRLKDGGECAIQLELRGFNRAQLDGRKIWLAFDPASAQWTCSSDVERASLLPQACRN